MDISFWNLGRKDGKGVEYSKREKDGIRSCEI